MLLENFGLFFFNIMFAIFNALITLFVKPIIIVINQLLIAFVDDYELTFINLFTYIDFVVNNIITPTITWFIDLLPPLTFSTIEVALYFEILVFAYDFTGGMVIRLLKFIKRVIPLA